jgi:uncharacterized phage-associated protein
MSRPIRFEFSLEKLVDALAYFAEVGKIRDLTKLKAAKLLFFADKMHLLRYGRPILGDRYVSMDHGPVPSQSLNVMNRVIAPDEIEDPVRQRVLERLHVHSLFTRHPQFRPKGHTAEFSHLSDSDREVLDQVIATYGAKPVGELIELTHREHAWRVSDVDRLPGSNAPMPYRTFFEGEHATGDATAMRELVEGEQEDRDFIAALSR